MNRFYTLWDSRPGDSAVALGFFDGVHLGHRAVIETMVKKAGAKRLVPRVFAISPAGGAPAAKARFSLLQTEEQQAAILEELGVEEIISPDFSQMKDLTPEDFVHRVLRETLGAKLVVCGFNYHFGKGAAGDADTLRQICAPAGVEVVAVDPVLWQGAPVSSTRIRQCVSEGRMEDAAAMLGAPFGLCRPVVVGRGLGRQLRYPTVNQTFPPMFTVPRYGVYHSRVWLEGVPYHGVTNVGVKPTVAVDEPVCETYILDFSGDLYGRTLTVELLSFLRDEEKFSSVAALQEQVGRDVEAVRGLIPTK